MTGTAVSSSRTGGVKRSVIFTVCTQKGTPLRLILKRSALIVNPVSLQKISLDLL